MGTARCEEMLGQSAALTVRPCESATALRALVTVPHFVMRDPRTAWHRPLAEREGRAVAIDVLVVAARRRVVGHVAESGVSQREEERPRRIADCIAQVGKERVVECLEATLLVLVLGRLQFTQHIGVAAHRALPEDDQASSWTGYWVDENGMACENMQQADLNGDGKPELIAAGRVSKNLKIYWNR